MSVLFDLNSIKDEISEKIESNIVEEITSSTKSTFAASTITTTKSILPWDIIVHFSGGVPKSIIPCDGIHSLKFSFVNSIKQSLFLMHGSTKTIMALPKAEQNLLWESVVSSKTI